MSHFQELIVDPLALRRFDVKGPRYTSYPTADRFVGTFNADSAKRWLSNRNLVGALGAANRALSLYLHIPFCSTICYYCACNKIITKDHGRSAKYIKYLGKELALQAAMVGAGRNVVQLHLGGGTPTFLSDAELRELMGLVRSQFNLAPNGEYSIEIDPRNVSETTVALLGELGFNRMSLGVQDFDLAVQKAVNRMQSLEETRAVLEAARRHGFASVGIDLIYGLPKQTLTSFDRSITLLLELQPDRIALFNYAHLPALAKPQRRINEADLPSAETKLQILQLAITRMTEAGYVFVGMDHFAREDDDLAVAQRQGRLHRNFQGYSTHAEADLLGFGVSAISQIGPCYSQNVRTLPEYYEALDEDRLAVMRGMELTPDDLLRRSIIQSLMCHFELSIESIELAHLIDFKRYFAGELTELRSMVQAGLLTIDDEWITVLPRGRLLVRVIAMVFDRYLQADRERVRYSSVI